MTCETPERKKKRKKIKQFLLLCWDVEPSCVPAEPTPCCQASPGTAWGLLWDSGQLFGPLKSRAVSWQELAGQELQARRRGGYPKYPGTPAGGVRGRRVMPVRQALAAGPEHGSSGRRGSRLPASAPTQPRSTKAWPFACTEEDHVRQHLSAQQTNRASSSLCPSPPAGKQIYGVQIYRAGCQGG